MFGIFEAAQDALKVEAQAPLASAEADRAKLAGVRVDPLSLNAEYVGQAIGVDQAHGRLAHSAIQQLSDAARDRLDVVGVEPHGLALPVPVGVGGGSDQCSMRARAMAA